MKSKQKDHAQINELRSIVYPKIDAMGAERFIKEWNEQCKGHAVELEIIINFCSFIRDAVTKLTPRFSDQTKLYYAAAARSQLVNRITPILEREYDISYKYYQVWMAERRGLEIAVKILLNSEDTKKVTKKKKQAPSEQSMNESLDIAKSALKVAVSYNEFIDAIQEHNTNDWFKNVDFTLFPGAVINTGALLNATAIDFARKQVANLDNAVKTLSFIEKMQEKYPALSKETIESIVYNITYDLEMKQEKAAQYK